MQPDPKAAVQKLQGSAMSAIGAERQGQPERTGRPAQVEAIGLPSQVADCGEVWGTSECL